MLHRAAVVRKCTQYFGGGGEGNLEDLGVDGRIILQCNLKKLGETDFIGLRMWTSGRLL